MEQAQEGEGGPVLGRRVRRRAPTRLLVVNKLSTPLTVHVEGEACQHGSGSVLAVMEGVDEPGYQPQQPASLSGGVIRLGAWGVAAITCATAAGDADS